MQEQDSARRKPFFQSYYSYHQEHMTIDARMMAEADPLPILLAGNIAEVLSDDVTEVVNQVITDHLAVDIRPSSTSSISHMQGGIGGDQNHASLDMSPHEQLPVTRPSPVLEQVVKAIWTTSFFTLVPAISTTLYKPARGVVFGHSKVTYYTVLFAILASGIGEATTAFCLSRAGGDNHRRLTFGRAVLCASVFPLILILGIAGYGFIQG